MTNAGGASVKLTNIGATVVSVEVPDRDGRLANVALGYDDFKSYFGDGPCMGKTVGRFANRIRGAKFTLDGVEYRLSANCSEGRHHTHGGGINGFANKIWESRVETDRVVFLAVQSRRRPGVSGRPGTPRSFTTGATIAVEITYYAKTTAPTIINLTNHSYFNLKGEDRPGAMDQLLQINGSKYLRYDADCVCTGELVDVKGTPMDFSEPKALSAEIDADYEPLRFGSGYDQSWAIDGYEKENFPKRACCTTRRADGGCGSGRPSRRSISMPETIWKAVRKVSAAIRTGAAPAWRSSARPIRTVRTAPAFRRPYCVPGDL